MSNSISMVSFSQLILQIVPLNHLSCCSSPVHLAETVSPTLKGTLGSCAYTACCSPPSLTVSIFFFFLGTIGFAAAGAAGAAFRLAFLFFCCNLRNGKIATARKDITHKNMLGSLAASHASLRPTSGHGFPRPAAQEARSPGSP